MAFTATLTERSSSSAEKADRIRASLPAALLRQPKFAKLDTRQRVWRPKVKTGCMTCRRRRIKCDEGKPLCRRCSTADIKCEGYTQVATTAVGSSWENHSWDHSANPTVILSDQSNEASRADVLSGLSVPPRLYAFDSLEEAESFDFFQSYSIRELNGLFGTYEGFWHDSVLPASMTQPTIRYAVTALGALHSRFVNGQDTSVPEDTSDVQIRFALQQCSRSFKAFLGYSDSQGLNSRLCALVACIIYICVASLQGLTSLTAIHFRNGINLVNSLDRSGKSTRQGATEYDAQFASLVTVLTTLETQARSLLCHEKLPACIATLKSDYQIPFRDKVVIDNATQAWDYFEAFFSDLQCFIQDQETSHEWSCRGVYPRRASVDQYKILVDRNTAGKEAIESLRMRQNQEHGREQKTLLVIRLHAHIFDMYLKSYPLGPELGELAWDNFELQFREMVTLSRQILECSDEELSAAVSSIEAGSVRLAGRRSNSHQKIVSRESILANNHSRHKPVFTFSHGTSGPLFTVAMQCRAPDVRRQAVALLLLYPRREGLWDSFTAGRVAWETIQYEEEMCRDRFGESFQVNAASDIPASCRIRGVEVSWTGPRMAKVGFNTVGEHEKGEPVVIDKTFEW